MLAHLLILINYNSVLTLEKNSHDQKYDLNKTELIHIYFIEPP